MHDKNIVHRDLKAENILLHSSRASDLSIKIADFGLSCFIDPKKRLKSKVGTLVYMGPEIFSLTETESYDEKVDVWSIGVIVFQLLTGMVPYFDDDAE